MCTIKINSVNLVTESSTFFLMTMKSCLKAKSSFHVRVVKEDKVCRKSIMVAVSLKVKCPKPLMPKSQVYIRLSKLPSLLCSNANQVFFHISVLKQKVCSS